MRARKNKIYLEAEQRAELLQMTRSGKHGAMEISRANILLDLDENQDEKYTQKQIACKYRVCPETVANVARRFVEGGIACALESKKREIPSPVPSKFTGEVETRIVKPACSAAPKGRKRRTLNFLAEIVRLEILREHRKLPPVFTRQSIAMKSRLSLKECNLKMTKIIHVFLTIMITFALLSNAAWAQELETPIFENIAELTAISDEPVELHIGLIEERLADNYPLEMAFLRQYPNGKVVYHLLTSEQLSAYLLSNESIIDLLILTNRLAADYAKLDVCVNFYDTQLLSAWPETWIDVRSQAEIDGKLYGFPKAIYQDFYGWNESLAQSMGVDKPNQIWTWDDYRVLCQALPYDLDGDGNKEFLLMRGNYHISGLTGFINDFLEQYAYQYALQGGSFQTPEFEQLNQLFVDILSSGALSDVRGVVPIFEGADALLISAFTGDSTSLFSGDQYSFLPYPTLNAEDPGYAGWFYTYSLPKSAPHPDLAINFLSNALNPDMQSMTAELNQVFTRTLPKYSVANEAVSLYDAFAPDAKGEMTYTVSYTNGYSIYHLADYIGDISPEDFETYQFMREHLLPNTGHWYELSSLWFEMFDQYMSGNIPLSELTRAMDSRMAMMQGE